MTDGCSRSFAGFWKCRKRRIRCDGGRPSYSRCINAGFECSGYGFRFDIPFGVQPSRQRLPAASRPDLYLRLTNEEIQQHLNDIDSTWSSKKAGPVSVTCFSSCSPQCNGHVNSQCQVMDESREAAVPRQARCAMLSSEPTKERGLFEHCIMFVADQLQPFADQGSEDYQNTGPSMALKGKVFEAEDMEVDATRSVFHAICSVGAPNFCRTTDNSPRYSYLALYHENLAIRHLQRCIEKRCTSYLAMATTILYLCLGEQVAGHTRWPWEHMEAGIRCLMLCLPRNGRMDCYTASICAQYVYLGLLRTDVHATERQAVLKALARSLGPDGQQRFVIDLRLLSILYRCHEISARVPQCQYPVAMADLYQELEGLNPFDRADTRQNRIRRVAHQASRIAFARHMKRARP